VQSPPDKVRQILSAEEVARCLEDLAARIARKWPQKNELALVGVHRRGVPFSLRLAELLRTRHGKSVVLGTVDITQYRDDLLTMAEVPQLEGSDIGFDVEDAVIILCDEVIYTGRTTRAALEELLDHGRPACVELAVLVNRSGRELPIHPDYEGAEVAAKDIQADERVSVRFVESDGWDEVFIRKLPQKPS
jgi:pyrimidine operon attenuation protein / uracil phosphoribosyltransferase